MGIYLQLFVPSLFGQLRGAACWLELRSAVSSDQSETVIFGRFCLLIEEQARVCTLQVITDELKGESTSNRDRKLPPVFT